MSMTVLVWVSVVVSGGSLIACLVMVALLVLERTKMATDLIEMRERLDSVLGTMRRIGTLEVARGMQQASRQREVTAFVAGLVSRFPRGDDESEEVFRRATFRRYVDSGHFGVKPSKRAFDAAWDELASEDDGGHGD